MFHKYVQAWVSFVDHHLQMIIDFALHPVVPSYWSLMYKYTHIEQYTYLCPCARERYGISELDCKQYGKYNLES